MKAKIKMRSVTCFSWLRRARPFEKDLENVLRAKTGALIVVGYSPEVMEIVDGGFSINCDFTPNYLYELAKMDGAIILSEDLKRILYANTQLIPDSSIPSSETGIRHRTAERVAKTDRKTRRIHFPAAQCHHSVSGQSALFAERYRRHFDQGEPGDSDTGKIQGRARSGVYEFGRLGI